MTLALRLSGAQGDVAADLLTVCQFIGAGDLAVTQSHPAGIQPQCLGQQDQLFSVVTDLFIQIFPLLSGHHQVVLHSGERSVSHQAAEGLGFAGHQLDV